MTVFSHNTTITIHILSTFPGDRLSSFLANSAEKIFRLLLGCHALDTLTRGGPPPPPLVTPLHIK